LNHRRSLLVLALLLVAASATAETSSPSAARQRELVTLVRQDCGSCHGMTLSGGLGPALLPAALKDKPANMLVYTVLHGRPGTPMPPWKPFLSEDEAGWLVDKLLKGFPDGH
jgi:cytochrome c55X